MDKVQEQVAALVKAEAELDAARVRYKEAAKYAADRQAEMLTCENLRDRVKGELKKTLGF